MGDYRKECFPKQVDTALGVFPILREGKMSHDPRYPRLGKPGKEVEDLRYFFREKAETPHSRVYLEVEIQKCVWEGRMIEESKLVGMMENGSEPFLKTKRKFWSGKSSEKNDRSGKPSPSQGKGFVGTHHRHAVDSH